MRANYTLVIFSVIVGKLSKLLCKKSLKKAPGIRAIAVKIMQWCGSDVVQWTAMFLGFFSKLEPMSML